MRREEVKRGGGREVMHTCDDQLEKLFTSATDRCEIIWIKEVNQYVLIRDIYTRVGKKRNTTFT